MKTKWFVFALVTIVLTVVIITVAFGVSMKRSDENISRIDRHIEEVLNGR